LFDTLLLLSEGKAIYFGPSKSAVSFFLSTPFQFSYKVHSNPADFIVAVAAGFARSNNDITVTPSDLINYYEQSTTFKELNSELNIQGSTKFELETNTKLGYLTSTINQIQTLSYRVLKVNFRDPKPAIGSMFRLNCK
jgi:ABC-type multidrug transport system ATPase subunit